MSRVRLVGVQCNVYPTLRTPVPNKGDSSLIYIHIHTYMNVCACAHRHVSWCAVVIDNLRSNLSWGSLCSFDIHVFRKGMNLVFPVALWNQSLDNSKEISCHCHVMIANKEKRRFMNIWKKSYQLRQTEQKAVNIDRVQSIIHTRVFQKSYKPQPERRS